LVYATSGRKNYSSVVDDGNNNSTINDVDDFDVTSLRVKKNEK
jgi:hypothetical protein